MVSGQFPKLNKSILVFDLEFFWTAPATTPKKGEASYLRVPMIPFALGGNGSVAQVILVKAFGWAPEQQDSQE